VAFESFHLVQPLVGHVDEEYNERTQESGTTQVLRLIPITVLPLRARQLIACISPVVTRDSSSHMHVGEHQLFGCIARVDRFIKR
jgi:hypothetical protein